MQVLSLMASALLLLHPLALATKTTPMSTSTSTSTPTPTLSITASGSTTIGLQIFANSNLTGGSAPSGSLTFRLFGPGDTSCASSIFTSTVPVSGTSMNSAHYTTSAAGTYRWTSMYSGDANNNAVGPTACSDPGGAVIVGAANTGLSVSAPAPSGGTIHGAASLGNGLNPGGTMTFYLSGPGDTFCSQTIFTSTVSVQGNGVYASGNYTASVTGTYRWRASYSGDTNNMADPVTACLDQNDSVAVTSVSQPPPTPPTLAVSPTGVTFAAQTTGTTSAAQTVTVSNTGGSNLTISTVGSSTAEFPVSNDHCGGTTVAPSGTCTVGVSFAPSAVGSRSGALTVTDNAAASPQAVGLSGQGTAPGAAISFTPTNLTFAAQTVGTASATQAVTVSNTGGSNLTISTLGSSSSDFALTNNRCSGATIAPRATCSVSVSFAPTATGTRSASLSVTDNAAASPQSVTLSGQGTADRGLFTYPVSGQSAVDTTRSFSWALSTAGQGYDLVIGTTQYGTDLVNSGVLPANQSTFNVPALPVGRTLYATLLTETGGSWSRYQGITFTAAPGLATFTNPLNGQSKVGRNPIISWSTIPQAQAYDLVVGTTKFGSDVVSSGILSPTQSTFSGASLPAGKTLYATILTEINGSWTRYQAITFTT